MCGIYIVCTSNLDLVSFLFVPAPYSTLKCKEFVYLLVHNIIVYSETIFKYDNEDELVIVEGSLFYYEWDVVHIKYIKALA